MRRAACWESDASLQSLGGSQEPRTAVRVCKSKYRYCDATSAMRMYLYSLYPSLDMDKRAPAVLPRGNWVCALGEFGRGPGFFCLPLSLSARIFHPIWACVCRTEKSEQDLYVYFHCAMTRRNRAPSLIPGLISINEWRVGNPRGADEDEGVVRGGSWVVSTLFEATACPLPASPEIETTRCSIHSGPLPNQPHLPFPGVQHYSLHSLSIRCGGGGDEPSPPYSWALSMTAANNTVVISTTAGTEVFWESHTGHSHWSSQLPNLPIVRCVS